MAGWCVMADQQATGNGLPAVVAQRKKAFTALVTKP
jgi:hypothetical protein